jgi:predicted PurR-regulated permease PerM
LDNQTEKRRLPGSAHGETPRSWWWTASVGAAALVLGAGIAVAIWLLAQQIGILILGISIAALLTPLVAWLSRRMPRVLAVILVYLGLAILLALMGWLIIPPIVSQIQMLIAQVPNITSQVQQWLGQRNISISGQLFNLATSQISGSLVSLISIPTAVLRTLLDFLLIIFVSIYGLLAAPAAHDFLLTLFPESQQSDVDRLLGDMIREMGGYLRGATINGLIIGVLTSLGLLVIGVDFPLVLGAIAGLLELVPIIGPIVAAVPMLLIALLKSPTTALIVLIYATAMHQLESQILVPNIMGRQTNISPLLVLLGFSAGYAIGGPFGAVVVIPSVAALRVLVLESLVPAIRRRTGAA